ncbi:hypothetical protein HNP52_000349 [Sphingomonas kyeonggiensis]|uniref:Bacteriophage tail tape measure N-terminal domain-containing protein n=1 Tax=Sphingomonas kyeonggiensis TaxID=1268553 RepID=A0A7W7JYA0_9SPHN|nr:hypothetical protein [Sphingomonas kyeonggiensis]MBB4837298.1 hypothetical protein [Sphingomonas kyeonggiensis]
MARNVSIRLGTEGKAQVRADLDEIANGGDAAAKRWAKSFERADADVQAAMQRQANAAAKLAMIMPQSQMQMRINDANGTGFGQWEGSARQSAAAFRELFAEQERLEAGARALRAAIDPLTVAQGRFDAEMAEARVLISAGAISLDEYVAKLRIEKTALDAVTAAQARGGASANAHRAAMQGLSFQAQDAFTQISMGTNILSVLAIQGGQAAGQMVHLEGKLGAVANFMVGPWGLAITGGLLVLGALTDHLFKASAASEGAADAAKKHAEAEQQLQKAIEDQESALRRSIQTSRQARAESLALAQQRVEEAKATRDATAATLRKALADLNAQKSGLGMGGITGTANVLAPTQRLNELTTARDALYRQLNDNEKAIAARVAAVRVAEVPILRAEAEERADKAAAATARYERGLEALEKRYTAGKISQQQYGQEIDKLRAARDADTEAARRADRGGRSSGSTHSADVSAVRDLASELRALEGRYDPVAGAARTYREELEKIAKLAGAGLIDGDQAAMFRDGAFGIYAGSRADALGKAIGIDGIRSDAGAEKKAIDDIIAAEDRRTKARDQLFGDQEDRLELLRREGQLIGANDNLRSAELEKLKLIQDVRRGTLDLSEQDLATALRNIDAQAALAEEVRRTSTAMDELRSFGADFVDSVLSENTWSSWGNAGKTILKMIQDEFIKLALLNPLKNLINGNDALPTVTSLFSSVSKLFGGGNSGLNLVHEIGHNAAGTEYWSGGMSLVGENGPEIVSMPRGSAVTPAGETRRLLSAGQQPVKVLVQVAANDYFDAKVASISGAQLEAAAPHIAAGAATLAGVQQARRARRRLVGG